MPPSLDGRNLIPPLLRMVSAIAVFAVSSITQELIASRGAEGIDDEGTVTHLMSEKGEPVP